MATKDKTLLVIAGPTAVGKTALSIELAKILDTCILSADSRQFYKELKIGTATPSQKELSEVQHYFMRSFKHYMTIIMYPCTKSSMEILALKKFKHHDTVIACGGSGIIYRPHYSSGS